MRSIYYGNTADHPLVPASLQAESPERLASLRAEAEQRARGRPEARLLKNALEIGERYGDEIRRRYPELIRRVSGYGLDALIDPEIVDRTRLVCGSEGIGGRHPREFRPWSFPAAGDGLLRVRFFADSARATVELLEENPRSRTSG